MRVDWNRWDGMLHGSHVGVDTNVKQKVVQEDGRTRYEAQSFKCGLEIYRRKNLCSGEITQVPLMCIDCTVNCAFWREYQRRLKEAGKTDEEVAASIFQKRKVRQDRCDAKRRERLRLQAAKNDRGLARDTD